MLKNTLHQIFVPPTNGKKTNRFLSSLPVRAYISVATGGPTFQHNPVKGCISDGYGNVLVTRCI